MSKEHDEMCSGCQQHQVMRILFGVLILGVAFLLGVQIGYMKGSFHAQRGEYWRMSTWGGEKGACPFADRWDDAKATPTEPAPVATE